jgi:hypothetical protein
VGRRWSRLPTLLDWTHFLVRGLAKVQGELGLMTMCYNLRRAISLLGVEALAGRCRARAMPA